MADSAEIFRSVILAGERPGGSPLSQAFDVAASVMVPVAGQPALQRVISAIQLSEMADSGIICGPSQALVDSSPGLKAVLQQSGFSWLDQASGPAASANKAIQKLKYLPVLLTAGDHALLSADIVDGFCRQVLKEARRSDPDIIIGLVPYSLVKAAWPESKRTVLKFADAGYCGSNLFAILKPDGLKALEFWQHAEADRKQPWKIARRFGWKSLLSYLAGRLTLNAVLEKLSYAANCRISHVVINNPRVAVDVDTLEDQKLAEEILSQQTTD